MEKINHKKKIIFVGMPDMATVCLNKLATEGLQVVAVIPPHRSNTSSVVIKTFAQSLGVEVFEFDESPNEPVFVEKIKALEADVGVVCSYDKLLSKEFLQTTKEGYINCHPSLLPEYRGANPYHHIILNGEVKTGVTLHFMDETFDTGEIVSQKELALSDRETMGTLFNHSNFAFAEELVYVLKEYEKTGHIPRTPQPQGLFKTAPKVKGEILMDFNQPAEVLDRLVRSCNPFYNCGTIFRGTSIRIITADYTIEPHTKTPSHIEKHNNRLAITTKDGYIYPKVVQIGSWGIFDIGEFIQKFNPQPGEKIGL